MKIKMRLFKRKNGIYYVELKRGKWKSLRTRNYQEAKKLFDEIKRQALLQKLIDLEKTISLKAFINKYISITENILTERTIAITLNAFKNFSKVVPHDTPLNRISPIDINNFIKFRLQQGCKKTTVNIDLRHLKAAFNKAIDYGFIKENPIMSPKNWTIKIENIV